MIYAPIYWFSLVLISFESDSQCIIYLEYLKIGFLREFYSKEYLHICNQFLFIHLNVDIAMTL